MVEINPATAATRLAIEFLTLWMEDRQRAAEHIERVLDDPNGPDMRVIIAGQLNLSEILVLMLARERGAEARNLLEKAGDILREVSPKLPE